MKITKLVSFDLQGTLSDSAFSDEFWMELIPQLYAKKFQLSLNRAKEVLELEYQANGKYCEQYYNHRLRLNECLANWHMQDIFNMLKNKPQLDLDVLNIVKSIPKHIPIIILSATTRDFIDIELGNDKNHFHQIYSTIDDFNTPGKPAALYQQIANNLGTRSEACLHIGDCHEMDVKNARQAGWVSYHFNKNAPREQILLELKGILQQFLNS